MLLKLPDLLLKYDHQDQQDDRPQVLESPYGEGKVDPPGDDVIEGKARMTNIIRKASSFEPEIETIKNKGQNQDVQAVLPAEKSQKVIHPFYLNGGPRPSLSACGVKSTAEKVYVAAEISYPIRLTILNVSVNGNFSNLRIRVEQISRDFNQNS